MIDQVLGGNRSFNLLLFTVVILRLMIVTLVCFLFNFQTFNPDMYHWVDNGVISFCVISKMMSPANV